jgi:hypothetical protein
MDKPKKETLLNQNPDSKICLNCGFPNRATDSNCMYCQTSLVADSGLISWCRQTYYILRWRWELKQKRATEHKPDRMPIFKAVGFFLLGAILSGQHELILQRDDSHAFSILWGVHPQRSLH